VIYIHRLTDPFYEVQKNHTHTRQHADQKYRDGLIGLTPYRDYAVQIRQQRSEQTETDYPRPHRRTYQISRETYRKRRDYRIRTPAVYREKNQKHQKQIELHVEDQKVFKHAHLHDGSRYNQNRKSQPSHSYTLIIPADS